MLGDIGTEIAVDANRARFARRSAGVMAVAASRLAIEAELRRRVRALPGVRLLDEVDVHAPLQDRGTGERRELSQARRGGAPETLAAALVSTAPAAARAARHGCATGATTRLLKSG